MTKPPAPNIMPPNRTPRPISRGEYTPIMGPTTSLNRVTLSAEERALAAASAISEVKYARNKLKLQQMKKAGLIRD